MNDYIDKRPKLKIPFNPLHWIKLLILIIMWIFTDNEKRKSFSEMFYGCISHKHKWNMNDTFLDDKYEYCRCKYYECNIISSKEFAINSKNKI